MIFIFFFLSDLILSQAVDLKYFFSFFFSIFSPSFSFLFYPSRISFLKNTLVRDTFQSKNFCQSLSIFVSKLFMESFFLVYHSSPLEDRNFFPFSQAPYNFSVPLMTFLPEYPDFFLIFLSSFFPFMCSEWFFCSEMLSCSIRLSFKKTSFVIQAE